MAVSISTYDKGFAAMVVIKPLYTGNNGSANKEPIAMTLRPLDVMAVQIRPRYVTFKHEAVVPLPTAVLKCIIRIFCI